MFWAICFFYLKYFENYIVKSILDIYKQILHDVIIGYFQLFS
jgi:hypothetical protein